MPKKPTSQPGEELLRSIRAGFVAQGTTFTEWCRAQGVQPPNARMAIRGGWRGPKASRLVRQLIQASGARRAA